MDSFCEESGCVVGQFPKYDMTIFLYVISMQK
jgi:hypothetical protein